MSTTSRSATLTSCARKPGELRFEQPANLFVGQAARAQAFDGRGDQRLRRAHPVGELPAASLRRNERAGDVPQLVQAIVLQLPVRHGYGTGTDHVLTGEW